MAAEVIILGLGGLAVAVAAEGGPAPKPTNLAPNGGTIIPVKPPGSPVRTMPLRATSVIGRSTGGAVNIGSTTQVDPMIIPTHQTTNTGAGANGDPLLQGKLDTINAAARTAYDNLSSDAKQKGADALNSALDLDPPLTGDETWDEAGSIVGGAVGGAAGAYIGGPYGAKIGALVGAYLGTKLADLISKNWDDVKAWCDNAWGDVSDAVSDAASAVSDKAQEYADDAENYLGGLV